jgi:hypothetical protein
MPIREDEHSSEKEWLVRISDSNHDAKQVLQIGSSQRLEPTRGFLSNRVTRFFALRKRKEGDTTMNREYANGIKKNILTQSFFVDWRLVLLSCLLLIAGNPIQHTGYSLIRKRISSLWCRLSTSHTSSSPMWSQCHWLNESVYNRGRSPFSGRCVSLDIFCLAWWVQWSRWTGQAICLEVPLYWSV